MTTSDSHFSNCGTHGESVAGDGREPARFNHSGPTLMAPLVLDAKGITAPNGPLPTFSLRTWRRMDSSAQIPPGHKVKGRKVWRMSDLELWVAWGFPHRAEFLRRLSADNRRS